ncbi:MAG: serine/threonine protein kinase [Ruminococcaceae bacterium]|nr:serine/threonine protein kinase [Oscillospiraceae bacterium]
MTEFDHIIAEQFSFVKALKKEQNKSVVVLRHKTLSAEIVVIDFPGDPAVYEILKHLSHPNLPRILSVMPDGQRCRVIEEYINGSTVADILAGGLYTERGVRRIAKDICCALDALHSKNIIHRDIKPENIMVDSKGNIKLVDFDAARIYKRYKSEDTSFIGTAGFAAPEQFGFNQTDPRSDIFALGILMNVMLTGEHPSKKLYQGKLKKVIEKCINLDPNQRFSTARELYAKL